MFSLLEMKVKVSKGQVELPYFTDSKTPPKERRVIFSVLPVKLGPIKGAKAILRNISNGIASSGMWMLIF